MYYKNNYKWVTYSFPQKAKVRIANSNRKRNSNVHLFSHRKIISVAIKYIHQSYTLSTTYTFSKYLIFKKFKNVICTFFMYM